MFCSCKNVEVIETSRSNSSIRTMSSIKEQKEEEIKLKPRTAPYLLINKPKMVRRDALTCEITRNSKMLLSSHFYSKVSLSTTTEENNGMQVELTHKTEKSSGPTTTNNQKCTKLLLLQTKSERRNKFGILKSFKDMLMMSSMPSPEEMFLSA